MLSDKGEYRLGYRADIEGLRAVAILLVVACHAKVRWLAGGFVGVDVFYVLSGYLITGLLVQEIETTGELRFASFYGRRLRRLLPALLLMLVVTCVFGRLLLPVGDQPEQGIAASSAALWLSNFHFAYAHMDYFAPGAETNLFLHTWSLGVEEQFYLAWPLLVALATGALEGTKRPNPAATRLKYVFGGTFVLALALSLYWTWHSPRLAFYMMPSRAWQFAVGALVFLLVGTPKFQTDKRRLLRPVSAIAGWLGLAMVVVSAVLIDGSVPYPGFWALAPTIGTALALIAGATQSDTAFGVARWLSIRPMQAIGRVSYSWYLWHWPVLLLGAQLVDARSGWNRLLLVGLSLLIAALSYRFFETPIRHNRKLLARPRITAFAALVLMATGSWLGLHWNTAALARMQRPEQLRFTAVRFDIPAIYEMDCDDWYHSARVHACTFGSAHSKHTAIAIGDSVALQWFPAYRRIFVRPGWRLIVLTKSSCPMVSAPFFYTRIQREYTVCGEWRRAALAMVARIRPDVLVMGSAFTYPFTPTQWIDGTRKILQQLAPATGTIYIMRSTPALPFDGSNCLAPRSSLYRVLMGGRLCTASAESSRGNDVFDWLESAATGFPNVHFIDMTQNVCPDNVCRAEIGGKIIFRDHQHLTASFAQSLTRTLSKALSMPYASANQHESVQHVTKN